jgi:D-tyrosyl-tRNA(Tyr) deacylase
MFEDGDGRTNRSLLDVGGEALVVSQFTLYADTSRGRRPGFTDAAPPDVARPLWLRVAGSIEALGVRTALGEFGAEMEVELVNDGPLRSGLDTPTARRRHDRPMLAAATGSVGTPEGC